MTPSSWGVRAISGADTTADTSTPASSTGKLSSTGPSAPRRPLDRESHHPYSGHRPGQYLCCWPWPRSCTSSGSAPVHRSCSCFTVDPGVGSTPVYRVRPPVTGAVPGEDVSTERSDLCARARRRSGVRAVMCNAVVLRSIRVVRGMNSTRCARRVAAAAAGLSLGSICSGARLLCAARCVHSFDVTGAAYRAVMETMRARCVGRSSESSG